MKRKTAKDFDPHILALYDGYVHGEMSKRDFLRGAAKYVAAGVTATAVLESLQPNYALAEQVAPDDPSIETMRVTYQSPDGHGAINGLMATHKFQELDVSLLHACNSGDTAGKPNRVVGYAAFALH